MPDGYSERKGQDQVSEWSEEGERSHQAAGAACSMQLLRRSNIHSTERRKVLRKMSSFDGKNPYDEEPSFGASSVYVFPNVGGKKLQRMWHRYPAQVDR
jgi:hypothetical protein